MSNKNAGIYIIAEAGVNHNGVLDIALRLVDVAAEAGANAVKFQTFQAEALASASAEKAGYQKQTTAGTEAQVDMLRRLELSSEAHRQIMRQCEKRGIAFLSSPFDLASIDFLVALGLGVFKIPSGEITNLPYLRKVGALRKEIILSTGMSNLEEVDTALRFLEKAGTARERITLLHCTTEYPAPFAEVNLLAMRTMSEAFPGIKGVGYSDHTPGIEISIAAAALGASIIEKHFTLDKTMEGPDHRASLEPHELAQLVRSVRNIEAALGDGIKAPTASELPNRDIARKSLVAARDIQVGEVFSEENLTAKRPGTGVSPMLWDDVLGTKATRALRKDEAL